MQEVSNAASMKAIECLVFSDAIFKTIDENSIVKALNSVESHGAKTFAVDSSTDIGLRISSLGGIVALLRYAIRLEVLDEIIKYGFFCFYFLCCYSIYP